MTLLVTLIAAIIATVIWYTNEKRDTYKLGTLSLTYWGASLMWFMDFVFEYSELKTEYFNQAIGDIINDSLLGVTVVALGLIVWLIVLFIKDPKEVFKKKFTEKK
ncbi:MAG: hypothetical protein K6C14_04255 [Eubacterium sp.]|nr:hypothetical protein [Eubacterium sp.]